MARLAIRATGDKSTREHVATDNERVQASIHVGNKYIGTIEVRQHSDMHTYLRYYDTKGTCHVLLSWNGYSEIN